DTTSSAITNVARSRAPASTVAPVNALSSRKWYSPIGTSLASSRYVDNPTTPSPPISSTAHNPAVNGSNTRLHSAGPSTAGRQNAGLTSPCWAHTNTSPNRITTLV